MPQLTLNLPLTALDSSSEGPWTGFLHNLLWSHSGRHQVGEAVWALLTCEGQMLGNVLFHNRFMLHLMTRSSTGFPSNFLS